jgi:aryl-alcohol dehydrogenase-like predicted oxidoreductase
MEVRRLGESGFKVPVLSFGTGTFGDMTTVFGAGSNEWNEAAASWTSASRPASTCSTPPTYSGGDRKKFWARRSRDAAHRRSSRPRRRFARAREKTISATRATLINACEASLRRLGTDYIDIYQMHGFDALSPVGETLSTLDTLVRSGKVRTSAARTSRAGT